MEEIIKIGKNRLPVIIGTNGQTKRDIETKTKTSLEIDSNTCEVNIISDLSYYEIHQAKNVISAIARGFSPEHAYKLLEDNYSYDVIDLTDYVSDSRDRHEQIKGRVIGREGRVKQMIEKKNSCFLSIYGKTVAIIAPVDRIEDTREVIEKILSGSKHTTIFKMLKRNTFKEQEDNKANKDYKKNEIDDIDFNDEEENVNKKIGEKK
ncbi:MAG: KH domain-containing protein [archaeon]